MNGARLVQTKNAGQEAERPGCRTSTQQMRHSIGEFTGKFAVSIGADSDLYDSANCYGEKHVDLRSMVKEHPLDFLTDVSIMCKVIVESTIVLNCAQLGACTHAEKGSKMRVDMCSGTDVFFTIVFTGEFIYKLCKLRSRYWESNWNRFDAFLLCVTFFDISLDLFQRGYDDVFDLRNLLILKLLRLLRILRILRVLQKKVEMRMVLEGLVASFQSMIWVALMLGLLVYVTAIICVTFFSEIRNPDNPDFFLNFATIGRAMFSLFTLSIVADWTDIVTPVVREHWWSPFFFVAFIICATFGIMNLIIGVITERTAQVQQSYRHLEMLRADGRRMDSIKELADIMFKECESHGDEDEATITRERMQEFSKSEEYGEQIKELVASVSLPAGYEIHDCHAMFDRDASGTITEEEFVQGMGRLIFSNDFQRGCIVQSSIADVLLEMKAIETHIFNRMDKMEEKFMAGFTRNGQQDAFAGGIAARQTAKVAESSSDNISVWRQSFPDPLQESPKDLPKCRALLERLREPLAVLLANDLMNKAATLPPVDERETLLGAPDASQGPQGSSSRHQNAVQRAAGVSGCRPPDCRPHAKVPMVQPKPPQRQDGAAPDLAHTTSARSHVSTDTGEQVQDLLQQVTEMWDDHESPEEPDRRSAARGASVGRRQV